VRLLSLWFDKISLKCQYRYNEHKYNVAANFISNLLQRQLFGIIWIPRALCNELTTRESIKQWTMLFRTAKETLSLSSSEASAFPSSSSVSLKTKHSGKMRSTVTWECHDALDVFSTQKNRKINIVRTDFARIVNLAERWAHTTACLYSAEKVLM